MEFFDSLYKGFEAEHYVAGKLFSVGYEAFKLPGDFGFDLIVANQKEQSMRTLIRATRARSFGQKSPAPGRDSAQPSVRWFFVFGVEP